MKKTKKKATRKVAKKTVSKKADTEEEDAPKKKGEVPKSTRNRTGAQIALLRQVKYYQAKVKMHVRLMNQLGAMKRSHLASDEEIDAFGAPIVKTMKDAEKKIINEAAALLPTMSIWTTWLSKVRGIADTLGIQLVAHIQPVSDFANVAKLWAWTGYKVVDGVAVRRKRGEKAKWDHALKKVCYQVAVSFVKNGGAYRELYDLYRKTDKAKHPKKVLMLDKSGQPLLDRNKEKRYLYSDGHLHARGLRYIAKIFLSHLWQVWRETEGLPTPGPYPTEYLPAHTHVLSPWDFIKSDDDEDKSKAGAGVA